MRQAWRIVKEKHAATAFTGEGAARTGGRWNSRGARVVYTSATASLAALETLVHLNPPVLFKYLIFRIEFDDTLVEEIFLASLPADWTEEPPPPHWVNPSFPALHEHDPEKCKTCRQRVATNAPTRSGKENWLRGHPCPDYSSVPLSSSPALLACRSAAALPCSLP